MRPIRNLAKLLTLAAMPLLATEAAADAVSAPAPEPVAAATPMDSLDRARVHAEYGDGNFEIVIQLLEDFRKSRRSYPASDSFFVAKYLGVVYTSNPVSREKGKYWLYRMLQINPAADLIDMYVGEQVGRTFEKVRQEFIVQRNYRGINDLSLNRAVEEGREPRSRGGMPSTPDTVVVRDTVALAEIPRDKLPERSLRDFRYGWTWNLNLGLGLKLMDKTEWGATRQQKEFRLAFDIRQRRWPINVALDFMYAMSEDAIVENSEGNLVQYNQTSNELNAGVRKIFDGTLYSMRPFVGGGFGYITTAFDSFDFRQGTLGAWAEGGVYWELERHFNLGAEMIWSWAEIPYGIESLANAGGLHFQMIMGYHW
jgi:hypothetical protein